MESYAMLFFAGISLIIATYCQFDGRMGGVDILKKAKYQKIPFFRKFILLKKTHLIHYYM